MVIGKIFTFTAQEVGEIIVSLEFQIAKLNNLNPDHPVVKRKIDLINKLYSDGILTEVDQ